MHSNKNATSKKSYRGQWWWLSSLDCQSLVNETLRELVASDTRGPQFKSTHRQNFILNIYCQLYWKDGNEEKEAGNGPFKKCKLTVFMKQILSGFWWTKSWKLREGFMRPSWFLTPWLIAESKVSWFQFDEVLYCFNKIGVGQNNLW